MLKILSWNIRQGGGSRISAIGRALAGLKAEIVILSEYRNNEKGIALRDKLLRIGYRYHYVTAALNQENSVLIASIIPGNCILHPTSDPNFANNILEVQFSAFSLIGVYLPHKKKHQLLHYINDVIHTSDIPYIISGDYNTGKNHIDQKGNSFWYEDQLVEMEKNKYVDAFRFLHKDAREYSWFSHQGNGYRYDHTFIHEDLTSLISGCKYLHDWRESGLSDHSPMLFSLGD